MIKKIVRWSRDPGRYIPRALKASQQPLCYLFRRSAFFLQGQMDLNPKSRWHNHEFAESVGGYFPLGDATNRALVDLEPWDTTRRDMLTLLLRTLEEKKIAGDFVELGVYKGFTAKLIHHYAPNRELHLFDTFEGFGKRSADTEKDSTGLAIEASHFADTSLERVRQYVAPTNDNVKFYQGYFPDTIPPNFAERRFAFVHLDADLYEPILEGLKFFYERMTPDGIIVVHDYNSWPGARKAVDEFFQDKIEIPIPMPDKSGSAMIVKNSRG